MTEGIARRFGIAARVAPDEAGTVALSAGYFFFLLASYYVLRPLRDEMGVAAGVANLQWLFSLTFVVMLAAVPAFGAVAARWPRRRFIPWVYRFFVVNVLLFWAALQFPEIRVSVARVFFVWVSVFNLFAVTVFWGLMSDLFRLEQGKRLFALIAAGGTAGALVGPSLTALLAAPLGPVNLLLVAAVLLELATGCVRRLVKGTPAVAAPTGAQGSTGDAALGGGVLAGLTDVLKSRYLLFVCAHVLLLSLTNTFLYFQQASIVAGAFDDPAERTRVFALIDLSVGIATLLIQLTVTGRVLTRFGPGPALAFLAIVTAAGFSALAVAPVLGVLIGFQVAKRAAEFAVSNPARETLFTVVPTEQKYKAKSFIDTAVFRGGDAVSGWAYSGLRFSGLDLSAIAWIAVPVALGWAGLVLALGRMQAVIASAAAEKGGGSG